MLRILKNKLKPFYYKFFYLLDRIIPKQDNLYVISSNAYLDNSAYYFEFLVGQSQISVYWLAWNYTNYQYIHTKFPNNVLYIDSVKGKLKFLRAKVVIFSHGYNDFKNYLHFSSPKLKVNLWHGTPMKAIALLASDKSHFDVRNLNFDLIPVSSDYEKKQLMRAFNLPSSHFIKSGTPRDAKLHELLSNSSYKMQVYDRLTSHLNFTPKAILLYAPTFRGYTNTKIFQFPDFDFQKFHQFLVTNNILLILRLHKNDVNSQSYELINQIQDSSHIIFANFTTEPNITDLYLVSDLLITDYSGAVFDFSLTRHSTVFLPYDLSEYTQKIGFLTDYTKLTKDHVSYTLQEFMKLVLDLLQNDDSQYVESLVATYHQYSDPSQINYNILKAIQERI